MTVTKVESPYFDVSVCRSGGDERGVRRDVHRQNRKFVTVEGKEELQRVAEEDLYCGVQQRHRDELRVWSVLSWKEKTEVKTS